MCDPGMDLSVDNHARNELIFQVTILDSVIWPSSLKALVGKKNIPGFQGQDLLLYINEKQSNICNFLLQ